MKCFKVSQEALFEVLSMNKGADPFYYGTASVPMWNGRKFAEKHPDEGWQLWYAYSRNRSARYEELKTGGLLPEHAEEYRNAEDETGGECGFLFFLIHVTSSGGSQTGTSQSSPSRASSSAEATDKISRITASEKKEIENDIQQAKQRSMERIQSIRDGRDYERKLRLDAKQLSGELVGVVKHLFPTHMVNVCFARQDTDGSGLCLIVGCLDPHDGAWEDEEQDVNLNELYPSCCTTETVKVKLVHYITKDTLCTASEPSDQGPWY
eukprot:gb/GECG01008327.1/.p1 GENE.gb/GECG01008327.1/~~gb/GECG01008327.1/.p1  ORF type:complete len:266 (+),score=37.63 gb/GECG01008327.1/:1-798(+)